MLVNILQIHCTVSSIAHHYYRITTENFMTHEVAYFSFGAANPDGAEHLRQLGDNVFGFEDLPGNLSRISDNDFNDGILAFTFIG